MLMVWAKKRNNRLEYIQPGKSLQNGKRWFQKIASELRQ